MRFNRDDVILKQGSDTRGSVFLVLYGDCNVIAHDGERGHIIGTREAGSLIGEMAVVTGVHSRNASVVARTPVMLCEFSEETFYAFVRAEGLVPGLRTRWQMRDHLSRIPVLQSLSTAVIERLCDIADEFEVAAGAAFEVEPSYWYLIVAGEASANGNALSSLDEGGELPFGRRGWQQLENPSGCRLVRLRAAEMRQLSSAVPQLGYRLRSYRQNTQAAEHCDWRL